jgi:YD repeat-containing protein
VPKAIISPDGIRTELSIDGNNHLKRVAYADGNYYAFEYSPDGLMMLETEPAGNSYEHIFNDQGRLTDVLDGEGGHWTYSRMVEANSEIQTEAQSAEGNLNSFLGHTDSTGKYTSTIIDPSGAITQVEQSGDGLTETHLMPCGMGQEYIYDIDSEFKYKFTKQMTESSPALLERVTSIEKTYTDTNEDDISDLIVETVTINGKPTIIQNNTQAAQKIITSPEGRSVISLYDPETLQVDSVNVSGLIPTAYNYNTRGKLTSVSTGTRQTVFTYSPDGFLESVTDAEGNKISYEYDPIGRITGINKPD